LEIEICWHGRCRRRSPKELEAENAQMHRIIAKLTLKVDAMDNLILKNGWGLRSDEKP